MGVTAPFIVPVARFGLRRNGSLTAHIYMFPADSAPPQLARCGPPLSPPLRPAPWLGRRMARGLRVFTPSELAPTKLAHAAGGYAAAGSRR